MMREGQTFKFRGELFVIRKVFTDTVIALNLSSTSIDIKKFAHLKLVK